MQPSNFDASFGSTNFTSTFASSGAFGAGGGASTMTYSQPFGKELDKPFAAQPGLSNTLKEPKLPSNLIGGPAPNPVFPPVSTRPPGTAELVQPIGNSSN